MRLLFVSHCLPPASKPITNVGGMQRVASELTDALAARADIVYDTIELRSPWKGLHRKVPRFLVRTHRQLRMKAERHEVDVVLFSSMVTAALAMFLRKRFRQHGVASAAIVHGLDVTMKNPVYQWIVPRILQSLDLVLPVSRATAAACIARGLPPSRMHIVPNGIDTNRFPLPDFTRKHERKRRTLTIDPSVPDDAFIVCSVGRQVERKGFAWFAGSVMPLLPDHVHYVLAGDGPESESIRSASQSSGTGNRVHLLGRIGDEALNEVYRAADLFVMPNIPIDGDIEGFGVVMLEASLSGLPTVASSLEGITDVIENGENGVLVEPLNATAFAHAVRRFYDDPDHLREASIRSHQYTTERYNWGTVSDMYVSSLRLLTNNAGSKAT